MRSDLKCSSYYKLNLFGNPRPQTKGQFRRLGGENHKMLQTTEQFLSATSLFSILILLSPWLEMIVPKNLARI